jgi:hypothetical protein
LEILSSKKKEKNLLLAALKTEESQIKSIIIYLKFSYENIEDLTSFKPFGIIEMKADRISFSKRIEELYKMDLDNLNKELDNNNIKTAKKQKTGYFQ